MTSDTSESDLEWLICMARTGSPCDPGVATTGELWEQPAQARNRPPTADLLQQVPRRQ